MAILDVSELKRGMVLTEEIRNAQGTLLLGSGRTLTDKDIWVLKAWGVGEIVADGAREKKEESDIESNSETKELMLARLAKKFSDTLGDPVMEDIMKAAVEVRAERVRRGEE